MAKLSPLNYENHLIIGGADANIRHLIARMQTGMEKLDQNDPHYNEQMELQFNRFLSNLNVYEPLYSVRMWASDLATGFKYQPGSKRLEINLQTNGNPLNYGFVNAILKRYQLDYIWLNHYLASPYFDPQLVVNRFSANGHEQAGRTLKRHSDLQELQATISAYEPILMQQVKPRKNHYKGF